MLPIHNLAEFKFGPIAYEYPDILLAQILGFIALLCFLWFVNLPYVSRQYWVELLNSRATRIETNKKQVDDSLAEVTKLRNDYKLRIDKIEAEARERIDAAVREAEAARADIIADAQQAAVAIRRRSEEEISRERTKQRILFRQQLVKLTLDAAESSVAQHSQGETQRRLIREFTVKASSSVPAGKGGVS